MKGCSKEHEEEKTRRFRHKKAQKTQKMSANIAD